MKKIIYCILLTVVLTLQVVLMSSCSESETSAKKFEYEEINGGIKITKYIGNDKKVVVPSTIENKKVIQITDTVFSGNVVLEELTLPEEIGNLSSSFFSGCDSLKELTFLGNTSIDSGYSYLPTPSLETLNFAICNEEQFTAMRWGIYENENLRNINIEKFKYISNLPSISSPKHNKTINASIPEELEKHIMSLTAVKYYRGSEKNTTLFKLLPNSPESNNNSTITITSKIRSEIIKAFKDEGYSLNSDFVISKGKRAFPDTYYMGEGGESIILTGKLDDGYSVETDVSNLFSYSSDNNKYTFYFNSSYAHYLFDNAVFYKEIDNSANMPICFCSRNVIVNDKNYSYIFG